MVRNRIVNIGIDTPLAQQGPESFPVLYAEYIKMRHVFFMSRRGTSKMLE